MSDNSKTTRFDHDKLFWHTNILTIACLVGGGVSVAHQSVMGHMLSLEDYGNFVLLLAVLNVINVPSTAIQTMVVSYTSRLQAAGDAGGIRKLLNRVCLNLLLWTIPLVIVITVFSPWLSKCLHIASSGPVVTSAVMMLFMLLTPVGLGALQGLQRFIAYIIAGTGAVSVRLLMGWLFVAAGWGLTGAMAGCLASFVFLLFILGVALLPVVTAKTEGNENTFQVEAVSRYFWYVLLANAMVELLMNLDLILVKRFFTSDEMGVFAQAGTIARMFAWITGPVILAMFPKIVHETVENHQVLPLFVRATLFSIIIVVGASLFCSVFPEFMARMLFKTSSNNLHSLIRLAVWTFAPFPVFKMMLNFLIARNQFRILPVLGVICFSYAFTLVVWHPRLAGVFAVTGCHSLLALGVTVWYCIRELGRNTVKGI